MSDIIKDLELLVEKDNRAESPERIVWVPICEKYKTAFRAAVYDEMGGESVSNGKLEPTKVLWWVKLSINPNECPVIRQIEARKMP